MEEDQVLLKVKTITDRVIEVQTKLSDTVEAFKNQIAGELEIPANQQRLLFQGRHLKNQEQLSQYGLDTGATVHVIKQPPPQPPPEQPQIPRIETPHAPNLDQIIQQSLQQQAYLQNLRRRRFPRRRDIANTERFETIRQNLETIRSFGLAQQRSNIIDNFRTNLQVRQWIDVIDTVDQWLEAQIIDKRATADGEEIYVHYNGWPEHWDEWISTASPRIQPLRTHTLQSVRSPMASPHPSVRPDAGRLQHETQTHNLDEYVTQSIDVLDQVKAVLEHYKEVRRETGAENGVEEFANVSRQVIPALDRTGRLMTDISRCLYAVSQAEHGVPPMPSQREVYSQRRRHPQIEIHIYNNYDALSRQMPQPTQPPQQPATPAFGPRAPDTDPDADQSRQDPSDE